MLNTLSTVVCTYVPNLHVSLSCMHAKATAQHGCTVHVLRNMQGRRKEEFAAATLGKGR